MFSPNQTGMLYRQAARDVHGRVAFGAAYDCPFAVVNMLVSGQKTSVRADSSASRGAADEIAAQRAKILLPAYADPVIGDKFNFRLDFRIISVHPRYSVSGALDHWECDLEVMANGS